MPPLFLYVALFMLIVAAILLAVVIVSRRRQSPAKASPEYDVTDLVLMSVLQS